MAGPREREYDSPIVLALVLLAVLGFGLLLFRPGWAMQRDALILDERGRPATATVTAVNRKTVTVTFTTSEGRPASANIRTATETGLGDRVQVRYDPADPAGSVVGPAESGRVFGRWALMISGSVVMLMVPYLTWYNVRHGNFRPRHGRAAYRARQRDRQERIDRRRIERRSRRAAR